MTGYLRRALSNALVASTRLGLALLYALDASDRAAAEKPDENPR